MVLMLMMLGMRMRMLLLMTISRVPSRLQRLVGLLRRVRRNRRDAGRGLLMLLLLLSSGAAITILRVWCSLRVRLSLLGKGIGREMGMRLHNHWPLSRNSRRRCRCCCCCRGCCCRR